MNLSRRQFGLAAVSTLAAAPAAASAKPKLIVTGDMGGIGAHRVAFLHESFDVVGIDLKRGPAQDLRHFTTSWVKLFEGASAVLHLAWVNGFAVLEAQNEHRLHEFSGCVDLTYNVIEAARLYRVPRMVFMSSAHADAERYGYKQVSDRKAPSLYGAAKVMVETTLRVMSDDTFAGTSIRLGHAWPLGYGPDPDFPPGMEMTDADISGLIAMAMTAPGGSVLDPTAARG